MNPQTSFIDLLTEATKKYFGAIYPGKIRPSEHNPWINVAWLQDVWVYILENKIPLRLIDHIPLVADLAQGKPWHDVEDIRLYRLQDHLLLREGIGVSPMTKSLSSTLREMTVVVLDSLPNCIPFEIANKYIHQPTQTSVLQIIAKLSKSQSRECIDRFNRNILVEGKRELLLYLSKSQESDWNEHCKALVRKLQLFHEGNSIRKKKTSLVAADEVSLLAPKVEFPVNFPCRLINDAQGENLALLIGLKRLDIRELVDRTLISMCQHKYTQEEIAKFMEYFLENIRTLKKCSGIMEKAKNIRFLKNSAAKVCKPNELFDPWDNNLRKIFYGEDKLPIGVEENGGERRQALLDLGLKSKADIRGQDLLETARLLDLWSLEEISKQQYEKAQQFMRVVNNDNHLSQIIAKKSLASHIKDLKCLLHDRRPAIGYPSNLQWHGQNSVLCKPTEICSTKYCMSVGSTMSVVDCESWVALAEHFNWHASPPVDCILDHLRYLTDQNEHTEMLHLLHGTYEELSKIDMYSEKGLNDLNFACIWHGKGFVFPRYAYIESPTDINLAPHLYQLPQELRKYEELFEVMGCHRYLSVELMLEVQQKIYEKHINMVHDHNEVKHDRQILVNILEALAEVVDQLDDEQASQIFFPVLIENSSGLMLKKRDECILASDQSWLWDADYCEEEGLFPIHKDVTNEIAQRLGVKSLSQNLVSETEAFEEWGQEEPLTRRIHNLLEEGYTDGFSIPKEIIQNADDAGATEVCFLYDEREHLEARIKLLDPGMANCQGPALWAYNNAEFSPDDLKNLTQVSGTTKAKDITKIGKFGLGFCSVYNVTDVPSLVTGNNIVIFDPHRKHLGKALPGQRPGLRINLESDKNRKLLSRLGHQFVPFQGIFGCTLDENFFSSYRGTLFRFPFRTSPSEIKSHPYSKADQRALLQKFIEFGGSILMFTQNVLKVNLYHLPKECPDPKDMKLLYSIEKCFQEDPLRNERKSVLKKMAELSDISCSFHVVQRVSIRAAIEMDVLSIIPVMEKKIGVIHTEWLISWTNGQHQCQQLLQNEGRGDVPLGAVAALVQRDGDDYIQPVNVNQSPFGFYNKSHLFCFLPLPLDTTLPVHVNAMFAVTSDRKRLQVSTQDECNTFPSQWNDALLGDAVSLAYLHLLKYIRMQTDISPRYDWTQLWPHGTIPFLTILEKSFYDMLVNDEWDILKGKSQWTTFSKSLFLDKALTIKPEIHTMCKLTVAEFNKNPEEILVSIPDNIFDLLEKNHHEKLLQRTITSSSYIIKIFFPNIQSPFWVKKENERNEMILYILEKRNAEINEVAKCTPCIPTNPSGKLSMPKDLVHPKSDISSMFSEDDSRFPVNFFRGEDILNSLLEWGMMKSFLTTDLLENRCKLVLALEKGKSRMRYEAIMKYLEKLQRKQKLNPEITNRIRNISFLPVMPKPRDWPFRWKAEEDDNGFVDVYARADQMFSQNELSPQLISCHELIVDIEPGHGEALNICCQLGLKEMHYDSDTFDKVVRQLIEISNTLEQRTAETDTKTSFKIREVYRYIYKYLNDACSEKWTTDRLSGLNRSSVVLVEDKVVSPQYIYSSHKWDCKPIFYKVKDFRLYKKFYTAIGIRKMMPAQRICHELSKMKEKWKDGKLPNKMQELALNLIHCLAETLSNETWEKNDIIALDNEGHLKPVTQLCFDDQEIKSSKYMSYVHSSISESEGKILGIVTKRKKVLQNCSKQIAFGQHEGLATRLKGLLAKYPCDFGILKELLQNADDANASEVHFIRDYRQLNTKHILDECYAPAQGPALCVYNNSSFTEKDINGIQNLGLGSKSGEPLKSGQYGVGFNVVYHLTDVPSFLTKGPEIGETLCFFDPMCKYVPNSSDQNPGMQYVDLEELRDSYSDVFEGYHEKKLFSGKPGTVFRFPLRNQTMAVNSDLSKKSISTEDVDKLLESFKAEIFTSFLFLKNVTKVVFATVEEDGTFRSDYETESFLSEVDKQKRSSFFQYAEEILLEMTDLLSINVNGISYAMDIKDSERKSEQWKIFQIFGFEKFHTKLTDFKNCGIHRCLPLGGVAGLCPSSLSSPQCVKGQAFCNLPLPVHTGLPVHVNGCFFLDNDGRRNIWRNEKEDEPDYKTVWNSNIVQQCISPAYVHYIEWIRSSICVQYGDEESCNSNLLYYFNAFPCYSHSYGEYWKAVTQCVYIYVADNEADVFPMVTEQNEQYHVAWTALKTNRNEF